MRVRVCWARLAARICWQGDMVVVNPQLWQARFGMNPGTVQRTPAYNPASGSFMGRMPDPRAPYASLYPGTGGMAQASQNIYRSGPGAQSAAVPTSRPVGEAVRDAVPAANPYFGQLGRSMLQQGSSVAPAQSPFEAIARALTGVAGGYIAGQANEQQQARDAVLSERMADLYGIDPSVVEGFSREEIAAYGEGEAKKAADRAAAERAAREKEFGQEKDLRKEFSGLSKDFRTQRAAYNRVLSSAEDPSAAGDLALIFNYMKVLDPGSVVRESEFATAAAAGAFGDRIQGAVNRIVSGQRLSDAQRRDFVNRAGMLYEGALDTQRGLEDEYRGLADEYGVAPGRVVPDYVRGLEPEIVAAEVVSQPGSNEVEASVVGDSAAPAVASPKTAAEYDELPSNTIYQHPDDPIGTFRTKK